MNALKKVECLQLRREHLRGLLDDYLDTASFISILTKRKKSLLRLMSRELSGIDKSISDSELIGKLSDSFIDKLNQEKQAVESLLLEELAADGGILEKWRCDT